ncbi:copper resistance D family protein [Caldalkalibacillus salinus]|uniref:copper resistance D family protein n=1 Tax=Caldalkalibacillus salinus TaxID=2803787 RepID=UPI0019240109|nr:CopD family protein [Caldalkalibacillus salinus]
MIYIVLDTLLYLCLAILTASFIIPVIPADKIPSIHIPKRVQLITIAGVMFLSFAPLLQIVLMYAGDFGFWTIFKSVLTSFEVGEAWIITALLCVTLFLTVLLSKQDNNEIVTFMGLFFSLLLILSFSWASHATSYAGELGFVAQSAHVLAISVWVGLLLVVGWWARDNANMMAFLKWFHPLAVTCVIVTIVAGFALMSSLDLNSTDIYIQSWVIPYGQALLIKHILFVPLLTFAFINGYLMRRRLEQDATFKPFSWMRVESLIILLIFSVTATLGQESPPHNIDMVISTEGPSNLFWLVYNGYIEPNMMLSLGWSGMSLGLGVFALICLGGMIAGFIRRFPALFSLGFGLAFVVTGYMALMFSVQ